MLSKLSTSSRGTEVNAVTGRIINEFGKGNWSTDLHLTGLISAMQPIKERLVTALERDKAKSDLVAKDEIRDEKLTDIFYYVTGLTHSPETAVRVAAERVDGALQKYGMGLIYDSYADETSHIESMLADLAEAETAAAVAVLPGLNRLISDFRAAHMDFEAALLLLREARYEEGTRELSSQIKRELTKVINEKLVVYLRAMVQVDEAKYAALAGAIGELIEEINLGVKNRREGGEDEAPPEGGTPNPQ